jgi:hypothetical protein
VKWKGNIEGLVSVAYASSFRVIEQKVNNAYPISPTYENDGLLTSAGDLKIDYNPQNSLIIGNTLGNAICNYHYNNFGEVTAYFAR